MLRSANSFRDLPHRLARRLRIQRGTLRWRIEISAPNDPSASRWGDLAFGEDLAEALRARDQQVDIGLFGAELPERQPDVKLVLRGLHRIMPSPGTLNVLWVISHPDDVSVAEMSAGWDRVYVASRSWSRGNEVGAKVLLQATSSRRFAPGAIVDDLQEEVLFVGTPRGYLRPVVEDAIAVGAKLGVYGHDWERFIDGRYIRADHLEFARVPDAYRSAGRVLNDHWPDMRDKGFLSNRLFDAAAAGALVISDEFDDASNIFGGLVRTYTNRGELAQLINTLDGWPDTNQRRASADAVRKHHSFDARAKTLVEDSLNELRSRLRHIW